MWKMHFMVSIPIAIAASLGLTGGWPSGSGQLFVIGVIRRAMFTTATTTQQSGKHGKQQPLVAWASGFELGHVNG